MIIQDRRNNVSEDINGGKLNFLEYMLQSDSSHQSKNNETAGPNPPAGMSADFYVPCSKYAFDTGKFFAPVFQHRNDQVKDNNDTPPRDYNIGALHPPHSIVGSSNKSSIDEKSAETLQKGMRVMSSTSQAINESPCSAKSSSMFCSSVMYQPSRNSSASSVNGSDVELKNATNRPPGFNPTGTIRNTKVESNCGGTDEPSKCAQRHACKHKDCGKSFTTSAHLSRHVKLHTGQRPHKCPLPGCKKEFARRDNMLVHYRTHAKKSGVEFGLTVVSARRASSGNIPQEVGGNDTDIHSVRFSQTNQGDNYALSTSLYQYEEMPHTRSPYSAFCVGQPHTRMSCPYVPSPIEGSIKSFKSGSVPQQPVSTSNPLYDGRTFGSVAQQVYGEPRDSQMENPDSRNMGVGTKYQRKQVCMQRQTGFSRQRSHSETFTPCGLVKMHPGMAYRPLIHQARYTPLKDGCPNQKVPGRQQEVLMAPTRFSVPSSQQQVRGLPGYYTNEKPQFEHLDGMSVAPDSVLPAVIKSLITGNDATVSRTEGTYCQQRPPKLEHFQDAPPLSGTNSARTFSCAATDISA